MEFEIYNPLFLKDGGRGHASEVGSFYVAESIAGPTCDGVSVLWWIAGVIKVDEEVSFFERHS